jgi:esterase/lipase superfamily enzyme
MFLGEARVVFQLRTFFQKIDIQLELWMQNARELLLYIHGYTVSYNSALKRAAQLKNDLKFGGLVILYSWPTMGQPLAYHRDGEVIMKTAEFLRKFIATILGEV